MATYKKRGYKPKSKEEIDYINGSFNHVNREEFIIDNHHKFMIGKHGPVIKKVFNA